MNRNTTLICFVVLTACSQQPEPSIPSQSLTSPAPEATEQSSDPIRTLVTGARIAGANGMHFGPDGLLYVASVNGSELLALNPDSGAVVSRLGPEDGVVGPDDVAFAADGSYFWTSIMTGEVAGMNATGELVTAAQLTPGVNPITFSDDGRLFVSQCFLGDKLYEVDPTGKAQPRLISDDLGPGCGLNGMDWGPDNRLYGPRWYQGEVVSFDVDAMTRRTEATGFGTPAAVKFDSRGRLHVLDTLKGQVIRIDGDQQTVVASLVPGLDNFAFDANDRIFVSSFTDGFVVRVEEDGSLVTLSPGGMAHPAGVTLMGDQVVIADVGAVRGFDKDTGESTFTERSIIGMSDMGGAINISTDADRLILTSWWDGGVRVWDPASKKVIERYAELDLPVSAVRYGTEIVVAEHGKQRVVAADGSTIYAQGIASPTGLAVDGDKLYVTDRDSGRILLIADQYKPLPEASVIHADLQGPEGIAFAGTDMIVAEAKIGQITRIGVDGSRTSLGTFPPSHATAGPGQPPSMIFDGIACDATHVYVTNQSERIVYKIRL